MEKGNNKDKSEVDSSSEDELNRTIMPGQEERARTSRKVKEIGGKKKDSEEKLYEGKNPVKEKMLLRTQKQKGNKEEKIAHEEGKFTHEIIDKMSIKIER